MPEEREPWYDQIGSAITSILFSIFLICIITGALFPDVAAAIKEWFMELLGK